MLNYTSLFADLDDLFRGAGRDPTTFRRLAREVDRAGEDIDDYYHEVATDYVARLLRRLARPEATLTADEVRLVRAFLCLPTEDPERDAALLDDLARLEDLMATLRQVRERPLNLKNLDVLRRQLARLRRLLPRIADAVDERERAHRFEEAVGDGGAGLDRDWLARTLKDALEGSDASETSGEVVLG